MYVVDVCRGWSWGASPLMQDGDRNDELLCDGRFAPDSLDISSHPTLMAIRSGQVIPLPCSGTCASTSTAAVGWLIGTPLSAHHKRPT